MASSLETGRPSTAACSNENDMELTFLDELRRVSVLMAVTTACCKEATLTSASTSEAAAPADAAASWNWGSEMGRRGTTGTESTPSRRFPAAKSRLADR